MNLNLGCGEFMAVRPWLNVDSAPGRGQVQADARALPFRDGAFERAYAGHVLEHVPRDQAPAAVAELRRVAPEVVIVGPDVVKAARMHAAGEIDDETLRSIGKEGRCDAADASDGDHHQWDCCDDELAAVITEAGFWPQWLRIVDVPPPYPVVSRVRWQCAAYAGSAR